jgi:hypothetical protein
MTGTQERPSRLQILQVADCPLVGRLVEDVQACVTEWGVSERVEVVVGDYPSPTLVIDGLDVSTGRPVQGGPCCRIDLPSREQIRDAVQSLR